MRGFWIEAAREEAFGARVRSSEAEFSDTWGAVSPAGFASVAWRMATPPELDPGLVRWHRRIVMATCARNHWDGGLTASVIVVSPWPAELTWSRQWGRDRGWRDWPEVFGQFVIPSDQDIARAPHLMASLTVRTPVSLDGVPMPPDAAPPDLVQQARRCVTVMVRELNAILEPLLSQLDGSVPSKGA